MIHRPAVLPSATKRTHLLSLYNASLEPADLNVSHNNNHNANHSGAYIVGGDEQRAGKYAAAACKRARVRETFITNQRDVRVKALGLGRTSILHIMSSLTISHVICVSLNQEKELELTPLTLCCTVKIRGGK